MIKNANAAPRRAARGAQQIGLGVLLLVYMVCAGRQAESLMMLLDIQILAPGAGLLMVTGSAFLALGVARSLYNARLGKVCLLLAAAELAAAAPQIGNWDYKLSQAMLATLVFGIGIAAFGAWLAHRAARS